MSSFPSRGGSRRSRDSSRGFGFGFAAGLALARCKQDAWGGVKQRNNRETTEKPTVERIKVEVVVMESPRVVARPAVDHEAVAPQVGEVGVGVLAVVLVRVHGQVREERLGLPIRILQRVRAEYLQINE